MQNMSYHVFIQFIKTLLVDYFVDYRCDSVGEQSKKESI